MLRLLGLDKLLIKVLAGGAALALVGGIVYAVASWWAATKAAWKEIGRLECQARVDQAYNRGLEENLEAVRRAVLEAAAARRANEELRERMEARTQVLMDDLDAQAVEMARLAEQACPKGEAARVPSEIIEILNRGVAP